MLQIERQLACPVTLQFVAASAESSHHIEGLGCAKVVEAHPEPLCHDRAISSHETFEVIALAPEVIRCKENVQIASPPVLLTDKVNDILSHLHEFVAKCDISL